MGEPILNDTKIDAIGEIHNISMGSAAIAISNMISSTVDITTPHVRVCKAREVAVDKLSDEVQGILFNEGEDSVFVKINYISGITGTSVLVLNPKDVQVIVQKLMGMPADPSADFQFDEMSLSAISEVMNQMMGASATAMSQMLGTPIDISPPETKVSKDKNLLFEMQGVSPDDNVCAVAFDLKIDDDINSKFVTLLTIELANSMVSKMFSENIGEGAEEAASSGGASSGNRPALDSMQCDAIGELQNMMMGAGATALSNFINGKVWITTPHVKVSKAGEVNFNDLEPSICVKIDFVKGIHGSSILVLKQSDVQLIINKLMGMPMVVDENFVFDEMSMSAVCEIMNQMMGASATTLSEVMNTPTDISTPEAMTVESAADILKLNGIEKDDTVCAVTFDLTIDDAINSHFATMLSLDLANKMADSMLGGYGGDIEFEPEPEPAPAPAAPTPQPAPAPAPAPKPAAAPQPAAPKAEKKKAPPKPRAESRVAPSSAQVQSYDMGSFDEDEGDFLTREQYSNLKPLLDVPMEVSVRIGTTQKRIEEVSDFTKGTIIELDTMANEPVDIMVNGNLLARGEVVVVDDNFAVRITEIVK